MADDNFDDLLGLTQDDVPAAEDVVVSEDEPDTDDLDAMFTDDEPAPTPPPVVKKTRARRTTKAAAPIDPLDAQIAEIRGALAKPIPVFTDEPEEDPEVTAKKALIKELQDQLARRNSTVVETTPPKLVHAEGPGERILLHFEIDGFIALGQTWYRGQELEFVVGGEAYKATQDRNGDSWMDLVNDRPAQIRRWGKVFFELGSFVPRPDEVFRDELVNEDVRRGRAVPIVQG